MAGIHAAQNQLVPNGSMEVDSHNTIPIVAYAGANYLATNLGSFPVCTNELNYVGTVATAGDAVALPSADMGLTLEIYNNGAAELAVFGQSGDSVNSVTNGYITVQPNAVARFVCLQQGMWSCENVGVGFAGNLPTSSYAEGLTASTTQTQAAGTPINRVINRFTTVATAGNASTLPLASPGLVLTVINAHATNAINIFPAVGDAINALATNAAYSLAATKSVTFYCTKALQWHTILSA